MHGTYTFVAQVVFISFNSHANCFNTRTYTPVSVSFVGTREHSVFGCIVSILSDRPVLFAQSEPCKFAFREERENN